VGDLQGEGHQAFVERSRMMRTPTDPVKTEDFYALLVVVGSLLAIIGTLSPSFPVKEQLKRLTKQVEELFDGV